MPDLLAELFSSKVRAAVLSELLPRPHLALSLTELSRRLALPISSLQHECYKLERLRLLTAYRDGSSRRYQVDASGPLIPELLGLVVRAIGPEAALRAAMDDVPGLEAAFLANLAPSDGAAPGGLVIIGEVPLDELAALTSRAETALGLAPGALELAFFRPGEWQAHRAAGHPYVTALLSAPHQILVANPGIALDPVQAEPIRALRGGEAP